MLLIDRNLVTASDLIEVDHEAQRVADSEGISLTDSGIPELATVECQHRLMIALQGFGGVPGGAGSPGMAHVAAVLNTGVGGLQPRLQPSQIVTHDVGFAGDRNRSPLWAWASFVALYMLYRDASIRATKQAPDRYEEKMQRMEHYGKTAFTRLVEAGLPFVHTPFPAPGAKFWHNAGAFNASSVTLVDQGSVVGGSYYVSVCWVDTNRYNTNDQERGDAESGPGAPVLKTVPTDKVLSVSIAGLTPPSGLSQPGGLTLQGLGSVTATHWNVLVGATPDTLYVQNAAPIPLATTTYQLPAAPALSGTKARRGQNPIGYMRLVRGSLRG